MYEVRAFGFRSFRVAVVDAHPHAPEYHGKKTMLNSRPRPCRVEARMSRKGGSVNANGHKMRRIASGKTNQGRLGKKARKGYEDAPDHQGKDKPGKVEEEGWKRIPGSDITSQPEAPTRHEPDAFLTRVCYAAPTHGAAASSSENGDGFGSGAPGRLVAVRRPQRARYTKKRRTGIQGGGFGSTRGVGRSGPSYLLQKRIR
ncbi:hypothetical protein C8R47DRAFT_1203812, partial [Mycena vitilis]